MDPDAGRFIEEERAAAWMARIKVGEVVKIKGEELEVVKIGEREITLKLLSSMERIQRDFEAMNRAERRKAAHDGRRQK